MFPQCIIFLYCTSISNHLIEGASLKSLNIINYNDHEEWMKNGTSVSDYFGKTWSSNRSVLIVGNAALDEYTKGLFFNENSLLTVYTARFDKFLTNWNQKRYTYVDHILWFENNAIDIEILLEISNTFNGRLIFISSTKELFDDRQFKFKFRRKRSVFKYGIGNIEIILMNASCGIYEIDRVFAQGCKDMRVWNLKMVSEEQTKKSNRIKRSNTKEFGLCENSSKKQSRFCHLLIKVNQHIPYVFFDVNHGSYAGIEIHLVETIAKALNLNVTYSSLENKDLHAVDIYLGGLPSSPTMNPSFAAIKPYLRNDLTWCVSASKPIPRWMTLFKICTDALLICVGLISFFTVVTLVYFLSIVENLRLDAYQATLIVTEFLLNRPTTFKPQKLIVRFLFTVASFTSMILIIHFLSFYTAFSTIMLFEPLIRTTSELARAEIQLAGEESSLFWIQAKKMVRFR